VIICHVAGRRPKWCRAELQRHHDQRVVCGRSLCGVCLLKRIHFRCEPWCMPSYDGVKVLYWSALLRRAFTGRVHLFRPQSGPPCSAMLSTLTVSPQSQVDSRLNPGCLAGHCLPDFNFTVALRSQLRVERPGLGIWPNSAPRPPELGGGICVSFTVAGLDAGLTAVTVMAWGNAAKLNAPSGPRAVTAWPPPGRGPGAAGRPTSLRRPATQLGVSRVSPPPGERGDAQHLVCSPGHLPSPPLESLPPEWGWGV
jgi:hypothetical protein